jgi:SAM-dependent methyltransferase
MSQERFQPISVKPPSISPVAFRMRCWVDLQLGSIVKHLRPAMRLLKGRVLDVGAGESPWREWLPPACTYQGIDIDNPEEFGMRGGIRQDVIRYDGVHIPYPAASFDGAICIEVLEHVENPDQLLSEIARVTKAGATLLLSVPWSARCHHRPHDFHRFTREQLGRLLARNGFPQFEIRERGNDIGALANKLVVLAVRLLKPSRIADAVWSVPLGVLVGGAAAPALAAAHLSDRLGKGASDDPLGYFVCAMRSAQADD